MQAAKIQKLGRHHVSYRLIGSGQRKILFFHGFPGSSIQSELFRPHLQSEDLQVLCLDRPGYNQSSFDKAPQLSLTLELTEQLCEILQWTFFEVFTVSGGTPFGLSFSQRYPALVTKVSVICGLGPLHQKQFANILGTQSLLSLKLAKFVPGKLLENMFQNPRTTRRMQSLARFLLPQSKADQKIIQNPAISQNLGIGMVEAFTQKSEGPKRDAHAFLQSWGWPLEVFPLPVSFWHGMDDKLLTYKFSELMAQKIPGAKITLVKGEGHYSLPLTYIGKILAT